MGLDVDYVFAKDAIEKLEDLIPNVKTFAIVTWENPNSIEVSK